MLGYPEWDDVGIEAFLPCGTAVSPPTVCAGGKEGKTHRVYGCTQMVYRISAHVQLVRTQPLVPTLTARDADNSVFLCAQKENERTLRST